MHLKKKNKLDEFHLRNKIENIILKTNIKPCIYYQVNLNISKNKLNNFYYKGNFYRNKLVNNALHFSYSMNNKEEEEKKNKIIDYNNENLIDLSKEKDYIIRLLFQELTFDEIKKIINNPEFYIRNNYVRHILDFFHQKYKLYEILNFEENNIKNESEDHKINRLIRNQKNEIINRANNEEKDLEEINLKKGLIKNVKEEIKRRKLNQQKMNSQIEQNNIILKNILLKTTKDVYRKINLSSHDFKNHLFMEKLRNKNIENLTALNNKIDNNSNEIIINPFPINESKNEVKNHEINKSKIFPTMPNPRHSKRNYTKNVRLKQLKKNMLEKETQNFINRYVSEIKECFNNKDKNNYLPLITN